MFLERIIKDTTPPPLLITPEKPLSPVLSLAKPDKRSANSEFGSQYPPANSHEESAILVPAQESVHNSLQYNSLRRLMPGTAYPRVALSEHLRTPIAPVPDS